MKIDNGPAIRFLPTPQSRSFGPFLRLRCFGTSSRRRLTPFTLSAQVWETCDEKKRRDAKIRLVVVLFSIMVGGVGVGVLGGH